MSRKPELQLTDHIRQVLHNHEEVYVLGSWERFQRKKRRVQIRKNLSRLAAAALLMLAFAFALSRAGYLSTDEQIAAGEWVVPENIQPPPKSETKPATLPDEKKDGIPAVTKQDDLPQNYSESFSSTEAVTHYPVSTFDVHPRLLAAASPVPPVHFKKDIRKKPSSGPSQTRYSHIALKEEDLPQAVKKSVDFSIAYASLMNVHESQTDLGMGGGFYTDWKILDRMTLTSGLFVAQNRLKFSYEPENSLMSTGEQTAFMQLDLVNMEIPIGFRYDLTGNFSFSAGIASVAYLKEKYNYTVEYEMPIQVFVDDGENGAEPVTQIITFSDSETQSEPSLNTVDWAAFYTFSFGYQQEVLKRHRIMFEPFIKIPTGRITSRNIRYTTGGVQVKFSF